MTVYVDHASVPTVVRGKAYGRFSHLTADSPAELHQFAAMIGVPRNRFCSGDGHWHYAVNEAERQCALAADAKPVNAEEYAALRRERRRVRAAAEWLEFCTTRAHEALDRGDVDGAVDVLLSKMSLRVSTVALLTVELHTRILRALKDPEPTCAVRDIVNGLELPR